MRIAIVGDGQMGLVLGGALAEAGHSVRLWGPFEQDIRELEATRASVQRLPDYRLPDAVELTAVDGEALPGAELVLNAIPTQFVRPVWERVGAGIEPGASVVCVSKGIEVETLLLPSQIMADVLARAGKGTADDRFCVLSGPTIAAELAKKLPATMVASSNDGGLSGLVQEVFDFPWLRVYRHHDPYGVELAGATKNVIALAAGMVDGLGAGANAKSALLARGLAEIARLGIALGADKETFFGVAGVGDLATTCFSPFGRNRTCGERLGRGETLDDILESTMSVVEGVPTTKAVVRLARDHGVDMPITNAVHAILFEGRTPQEAIEMLMMRERKHEEIG